MLAALEGKLLRGSVVRVKRTVCLFSLIKT